jgi:hypothetical protein
VAIDSLLYNCDVQLLLEMLGAQLIEVVVGVDVVQGQYQVNQGLAAANMHSQARDEQTHYNLPP